MRLFAEPPIDEMAARNDDAPEWSRYFSERLGQREVPGNEQQHAEAQKQKRLHSAMMVQIPVRQHRHAEDQAQCDHRRFESGMREKL